MYGPIWPDFDAPWTLSWKNITRLWTFLVHAFLYNFCMVYCLCSCFLELKGRQKWQVYLHNEFVLWRLCYLQLVYWFLSIAACSSLYGGIQKASWILVYPVTSVFLWCLLSEVATFRFWSLKTCIKTFLDLGLVLSQISLLWLNAFISVAILINLT